MVSFALFFTCLILIGRVQAYSVETPAQVEDYLWYASAREGIDITTVLSVVRCESNFDKGAEHHSSKEDSYGIFQINLRAHPEITKEQALDPLWSTKFAMDQITKGHWSIWSCYNSIYGNKTIG